MNELPSTDPNDSDSPRLESSATSEPAGARAGNGGAARARRPRLLRSLASRRGRWIAVAAATMFVAAAFSFGLTTALSATATHPSAASGAAGSGASSGEPSNARSGPATGGASGTVSEVSTSSFTLTTSAGQTVTVDESASTTYQNGSSSSAAKAIKAGDSVLALGTTNGTTITATQITVEPAGSAGSAAPSAGSVVPFQPGTPSASQQVGQIPANWSQGAGTIVSGSAANEATKAALAAYPGGIVDRVVQLSDGEYNVHYIGVNWPHHVFVSQDFTVVGAL